jgi:hypothetical protein
MPDDIQDVAVLDMIDDLLETNTADDFQKLILLIIPIKTAHSKKISLCVPFVNNRKENRRPARYD